MPLALEANFFDQVERAANSVPDRFWVAKLRAEVKMNAGERQLVLAANLHRLPYLLHVHTELTSAMAGECVRVCLYCGAWLKAQPQLRASLVFCHERAFDGHLKSEIDVAFIPGIRLNKSWLTSADFWRR